MYKLSFHLKLKILSSTCEINYLWFSSGGCGVVGGVGGGRGRVVGRVGGGRGGVVGRVGYQRRARLGREEGVVVSQLCTKLINRYLL